MAMGIAAKMELGDKVRVGKHWLRGRHVGTLIRYDGSGINSWLVAFDVEGIGQGFTDDKTNHQCLWLSPDQLTDAQPAKRTKRKPSTQAS